MKEFKFDKIINLFMSSGLSSSFQSLKQTIADSAAKLDTQSQVYEPNFISTADL